MAMRWAHAGAGTWRGGGMSVIAVSSGACRDSLLYKGSEDDDGLGVEVTG
jgi:hypothetical protein